MPTFSVRISDLAAQRFDAAAGGQGGRSALLRRLIQEAGSDAGRPLDRAARPTRLMVRLTLADGERVGQAAQQMGLTPSAWVAGLVRWRVGGRPTFRRSEEKVLLAIRGEVHRIGINLNQVARALNTAVLDGRVLELELAAVEAFRGELRAHLQGLRAAFEGDLSYWAGEP